LSPLQRIAMGLVLVLLDVAAFADLGLDLDAIPDIAGWVLSLPQIVFTLLLCGALSRLLEDDSPGVARRLSLLRWAFGLVAVGPVLLYGAEIDALLVPLSMITVAANLFLVYLLFRHHAQPRVSRAGTAA
jgi:hypothetical protein